MAYTTANGIDKIVDDIYDSLRVRVTNGGGLDTVVPMHLQNNCRIGKKSALP